MRIAFDQQTFTWQEYGGISRYFCSLAHQLSELPGVETKIFAPIHINAYLPGLPPSIRAGTKVTPSPAMLPVMRNVSRLMAIPMIQSYRPDIVHETYYSSWTFAPLGAYRVITAFDMIQECVPGPDGEINKFIARKRNAFARADHIICISENTRQDLLKFNDIPEEKVSVVYLGFDALGSGSHPVGGNHGQPYILYVGQRAGYKNFINFIQAYASSVWLQDNFRILCFGGGEFTSTEKALFRDIGLNESQIQLVGGDDYILGSCYRNAAAFVYPSLYEGFGIPPLEAMAAGCPVVCSNTSSIPEVVGGAGEYFDPSSIESIRSSVEHVLQFTERRTELVTLGIERCKLFTWEKCSAETHAIYQRLCA